LGADRQEHVNLARRELAIVSLVAFDIRRLDVVECEVAAFLITQFDHSLEKIAIDRRLPGLNADKPETQHLRMLRARRERPRRRRTAEQRYELAAVHSNTSSARASNGSGTSIPTARAVFRLIASSYLVGACTGRSAVFSPLRMRST